MHNSIHYGLLKVLSMNGNYLMGTVLWIFWLIKLRKIRIRRKNKAFTINTKKNFISFGVNYDTKMINYNLIIVKLIFLNTILLKIRIMKKKSNLCKATLVSLWSQKWLIIASNMILILLYLYSYLTNLFEGGDIRENLLDNLRPLESYLGVIPFIFFSFWSFP